ncbi:hypothetical protein N7G274_010194 [Stereocaulon virgatum]|uniref:CCHC-type domain-containing protein n=1 Tax=Stereocaulon virgatum TaxID=373712 RepID=A0ABR3ZYB0_9LECA
MPPIVQGQIFASLADFKNALRDWAIERNWTPHILDSDSHRVRAGCRSSADCPFRIRANYSVKRGDAKVTTCDDNHSCEPFRTPADGKAHQDIKRAETGKLKFLLEAVPKLMTVTLDTNILDIIAAIERKYGQKIPTRQAQKVKANLTERVKGPCRHCHQLGHTRRHCPQLRAPAPGPITFNSMQQDLQRFPDETQDDTTYGETTMEIGSPNERAPAPMNYINGHQTNGQSSGYPGHDHPQSASSTAYTQPYPPRSGVPVDSDIPPRIQRLNSNEGPVPMQSAITPTQQLHQQHSITPNQQLHTYSDQLPGQPSSAQNQSGNKTPQETRLEAAKLMQQAARLMHEAARLNSEAARLNASVASA